MTEDTSVFAFVNSTDGARMKCRVVIYGARIGFRSPSDCVWIVPGTWRE